jgi:hypothetical protein
MGRRFNGTVLCRRCTGAGGYVCPCSVGAALSPKDLPQKFDITCFDYHGDLIAEALERFVDMFNVYTTYPDKDRCVTCIIHGHSTSSDETSPSIKNTIRSVCRMYATRLKWWAGEDYNANPGKTYVMPLSPLPDPGTEEFWNPPDYSAKRAEV